MKANTHTLPPFLERNLPQIQEICHAHKVKRLWVFGSILRTDFHAGSDVDLLYELDRTELNEDNYLKYFFGLYDSLKSLFGSEVDLIKYNAIQNPYFLSEIDQTKILLYDQSAKEVSI